MVAAHQRAAVTAATLSVTCSATAFWAPRYVLGEGVTLTTDHADVLALVAQVQLLLGLLLFSPISELSPSPVIISFAWGLAHLIGATLLYHTFFVLFGAPLLAQAGDTALFSFCVAALGAFPTGCYYGNGTGKALNVLLHLDPTTPMDYVILTAFLSPLFGAWLGACAIPLDWDRPWQPWPISSAHVAFGAYSLAMVGCSLYIWASRNGSKLKSG